MNRFERQMRDFREWRPGYARARTLGAVACLTAEVRVGEPLALAATGVLRALPKVDG